MHKDRHVLGTLAAAVLAAGLALVPTSTASAYAGEDNRLTLVRKDASGIWQAATVLPDGTRPVQLTRTSMNVLDVAMAPSGGQVAYAGGRKLWLVDTSGHGTPEVVPTDPDEYVRFPTWTAAGEIIFMESVGNQGRTAATGSWSYRLLRATPTSTGWTTSPVEGTDGGYDPAVSADGGTIAFTKEGDVWTVPATGGTPTQITNTAVTERVQDWNPQDGRILFAVCGSAVYAVEARAGATPHHVTSLGGCGASYSSDATKLAFEARSTTIRVLDLKRGKSTALSGKQVDRSPDW